MSRVPALIVMHADLSAALLRAAASVYGPIEDVDVLSNEGLSREQLEQEIERRVAGWVHGGLVLTDFWGGSCHICGIAAARGHGDIVLLTGLNLPTLLDYLHNRDEYGVPQLAERLQRKGRDSIRLHHGQPA
jgi:mannose/fructose-specific phosphotransferase system component IIA